MDQFVVDFPYVPWPPGTMRWHRPGPIQTTDRVTGRGVTKLKIVGSHYCSGYEPLEPEYAILQYRAPAPPLREIDTHAPANLRLNRD